MEGGSILNGTFERAGVVDELSLVVAPIVADKDSKPLFMNSNIMNFELLKAENFDGNLILKYKKKYKIKKTQVSGGYMIRKLFPYGKKKAFNVTYDDGVLQDVRFVDLLNKYNLKGTFNLNSALMENEFEWTHESGITVKRLKREDVLSLYNGHEVASHTATHPYMDGLTKEEVLRELSADKMSLETLFSQKIRGFAVPFDYYSKLIEECVMECGFEYARISEESLSFKPQNDYYNFKATVFHLDESLEELTKKFIESDEELALFQIVGHTYDLDVENKWGTIENIFRTISNCGDILPMTTAEIINYLKAMDKVEISENYIRNNSEFSLWFLLDGNICKVESQSSMYLRNYRSFNYE